MSDIYARRKVKNVLIQLSAVQDSKGSYLRIAKKTIDNTMVDVIALKYPMPFMKATAIVNQANEDIYIRAHKALEDEYRKRNKGAASVLIHCSRDL